MSESDSLNLFLKEINNILEKNNVKKDEKALRGEQFNIFGLLGVSSSEVRLHSAILGELLNPKGSHGAGSRFLLEFIKQNIPQWGKFTEEQLDNATVDLEVPIGEKTDDAGGRIDIRIVIGDKAIIIENKIYAGDQDAQLLRYHNYGKKYHDHELIYLTLDGHEPSDYSTKGLKSGQYHRLSYQEHISQWITRCIELSHSRPYVRETLNQYLNTIQYLTDNNMNNNTEIKETAKKHLEEVLAIYEVLPQIGEDLIREHIINPLQTYADEKCYVKQILVENDPYYIRFKKDGEDFEIAVICDASRSKGWHHLYIAVHSPNIDPGKEFPRKKLDSLKEQYTGGRLPYGWEWLETHDWTNPKSFKDIQNGTVYNWIINKVEAIRNEIDANKGTFPMRLPQNHSEAQG